jgi:hypothetical protein
MKYNGMNFLQSTLFGIKTGTIIYIGVGILVALILIILLVKIFKKSSKSSGGNNNGDDVNNISSNGTALEQANIDNPVDMTIGSAYQEPITEVPRYEAKQNVESMNNIELQSQNSIDEINIEEEPQVSSATPSVEIDKPIVMESQPVMEQSTNNNFVAPELEVLGAESIDTNEVIQPQVSIETPNIIEEQPIVMESQPVMEQSTNNNFIAPGLEVLGAESIDTNEVVQPQELAATPSIIEEQPIVMESQPAIEQPINNNFVAPEVEVLNAEPIDINEHVDVNPIVTEDVTQGFKICPSCGAKVADHLPVCFMCGTKC